MSWLGGPVGSGGDGGDESKEKEEYIDPQRYLQPSAPYVFGANGGAPQLRVKLEPILLEFEEYTATHRLAFNMCALRPASRLCAFARARALAAAALTRADRWRCRARPAASGRRLASRSHRAGTNSASTSTRCCKSFRCSRRR